LWTTVTSGGGRHGLAHGLGGSHRRRDDGRELHQRGEVAEDLRATRRHGTGDIRVRASDVAHDVDLELVRRFRDQARGITQAGDLRLEVDGQLRTFTHPVQGQLTDEDAMRRRQIGRVLL